MKHFDEEEAFFSNEKKSEKKEKKRLQKKDRSARPPLPMKTTEDKGRVLSIAKEGIWVEVGEKLHLCSLKGSLKKQKTHAKNLVVVGDWVYIEKKENQEGVISSIEERKTFLSRTDISGKKEQLIAANVDQLMIIASLESPPLKPSLVDRYLISAEKGGLSPVLIINKIDLLKEKEFFAQFLISYEPLGIPILCCSAQEKIGLESLASACKGKTSLFSGQSGVGKSSLLNAAFGLDLKTGELTQKTEKGSHTTSRSLLIPLPQGGYSIDTPGIRSFSIWKLSSKDLQTHFVEFQAFPCKFPDCTHTHEPHCGVSNAVSQGLLSPLRYQSYCTLLSEIGSEETSWK